VDTFWALFKESVIIQALMALVLLGTICYLTIMQIAVPDLISQAFVLILGFYFGSKAQAKIGGG
jgi:hypothetical protein